MRFGILTFLTDEGIGATEVGPALEQRGFDSLFVAEHTHIPVNHNSPYPGGGPIPRKYHRALDPFVALTAVAATTRTLLLGTGIALLPERDPIITAKEVASLDLVSQGRFVLGVGVGWLREEVANHGVEPAVRGRVSDERLHAMIEIWTQDQPEFHGRYVDFDPIYCWPKPVTKPHPPLYVGGGPAIFKRIAEFGAGWIALSPSPELLAGPLEELRAVAGSDVAVTVCQWGDATAETLQGYAPLGVERVLLQLETMPPDQTLHSLDELAELAQMD